LNIWIPYIGKGLIEPALASLESTSSHSEVLVIETVKLDDQVDKSLCINFMKLDLEGHEMSAMRGAERVLQTNRPIVQFEENNMEDKLGTWQDYANGIKYSIFKINKKYRKSQTN
jgi:hypothetical protein